MFQDKPAWIAHQRKRWLRPDWRRYMRPDWHRWLTPESAPWLPPEAWPAKKQQPYESADDIDVAAHRRAIVELRAELAALKAELKFRQLLRKAGFDPDQPRVPAGQHEGGRWTREGGEAAYQAVSRRAKVMRQSAQETADQAATRKSSRTPNRTIYRSRVSNTRQTDHVVRFVSATISSSQHQARLRVLR